MKLRLIFKRPQADANGVLAENIYHTDIVEVSENIILLGVGPHGILEKNKLPGIIGGEWIDE